MSANSKDDAVRKIATIWCSQPTQLPVDKRLIEIAELMYRYRNDLLEPVQIALFPQEAISDDSEVMAAVEHYFFARSQVASGEYSATNMKIFILGYQFAKSTGLDLRHNKEKPTTPPSELQKTWAIIGAEQGKQDLDKLNISRRRAGVDTISPPNFRLPPNFTGSYGKTRLDEVRY